MLQYDPNPRVSAFKHAPFHPLRRQEAIDILEATQKGQVIPLSANAKLDAAFWSPVSTQGMTAFGILIVLHIALTFTLVILAGLQTNTIHMTILDVLYLTGFHTATAVIALAMHVKILWCNPSYGFKRKAIDPEKLSFHRGLRNDRRNWCLIFDTLLSTVATIIAFYIGSIVDVSTHADTFRDTGRNLYVNRALDLLFSFFYSLTVPMFMFVANEVTWMWKVRRLRIQALASLQLHGENNAADADDESEEDKLHN